MRLGCLVTFVKLECTPFDLMLRISCATRIFAFNYEDQRTPTVIKTNNSKIITGIKTRRKNRERVLLAGWIKGERYMWCARFQAKGASTTIMMILLML